MMVWKKLSKGNFIHKSDFLGTYLVVQWLGLHAFTAKGAGSLPGQGTKITQDVWHSQKKKKNLNKNKVK